MVDIYFLADGRNLKECYCCSTEDVNKDPHEDSVSVLRRLATMLSDPEAKKLTSRHVLLINHFLSISDHTFKIVDVHYLMIAVKHLCQEVDVDPVYETPLRSLLYMMQKPPIVLCNSQNEQYQSDLCDYFTALATCYSSLKCHEFRFLIISATNNIMCMNREGENFVNQTNCISALEDSEFVEIISTVLANELDLRDLGNILDLFMHLSMMSDVICVQMYKKEYVERLLCKVSYLQVGTGQHSPGGRYPAHLHRTAFLILKALATVILADSYEPLTLSNQAVRNLREWFKNRVIIGPRRKRNLLMLIILCIIRTQRDVDFVSSNLLEDIILLGVAPIKVRSSTWVKDFELTGETLDFAFKKLILATVYELLSYCPTKIIFEKLEGVIGVRELFDLKLWSEFENNIILVFILHLVPAIAKYLPEEIIKYDIISRMIIKCGKLVKEVDCDNIFFQLMQSIYYLSLNQGLTPYFKEKNLIPSLLDYSETILQMNGWSLRIQLVLQYTLNSIVSVASKLKQVSFKCVRYGHPALMSTQLLDRYLYPSESDSLFDPCLLIAIADFIWVALTKDSVSKMEFMKLGGIYLIIDTLEVELKKSTVSKGGTIGLLNVLSDILRNEFAVSQAVTWKGTKHPHLINLLCEMWRAVEQEKNVKRVNSMIQDCEAPLMGASQVKKESGDPRSCLPLLEMIGCVRPKIYSIIAQLLNQHSHIVEISEETYGLNLRRINVQDKITLEIIKNYEFLKEGEIWQSILSSLRHSGCPPLAGDELLLHSLIMKHISLSKTIQLRQMELLKKQDKKELEEEKRLYEKIKLSKITEEIDKHRQIEKELIIKDTHKRSIVKQAQLHQIEEASQSDWKKYAFIKSYNSKNNTTTLTMGRDLILTGKVTKVPKKSAD